MKELTNDDLDELVDGSVFGDWRGYAREVIEADRFLNAPTDLEHQSVGKPVAWLLTDKKINDIQVGSVQRLIDRARQAHFTDLIIRINGKDEHYQADWLKHLVRAEVPVCAPADRDVTRQAVTALECARDGLLWYQDLHPEDHSGADDEMHTLIDGAIAMIAAAPTPPTAQPSYTHADVTDAHAKGYALGLAQKDRPAEQQDAPQDVEVIELISQRDHREEIIDQLCDAVLGPDRAEWSSAYYFEDAVSEVQERVAELEDRKECRDSNAQAEQQEPAPNVLATLRAKVEALHNVSHYDIWFKNQVLALIDKMGGTV